MHGRPGDPGGQRRRSRREPIPGHGGRAPARRAGDGPRWLSVGRLAPNKAHQDTIAALFVARATTTRGPADHRRVADRAHLRPGAAALRGRTGSAGRSSSCPASATPSCPPTTRRPSAGDAVRARRVRRPAGRGHGATAAGGGLRRRGGPEVLGDAGVLLDAKGPRRVADGGGRTAGRPGPARRLVAAGRTVRGSAWTGPDRTWWRRCGRWRTGVASTGWARPGRRPASARAPEPLGSSPHGSPLSTCPHSPSHRHRRCPRDEVGRRRRAGLGHLPAPAQGADRVHRFGHRPEHRQPGLLAADPARGREPGA